MESLGEVTVNVDKVTSNTNVRSTQQLASPSATLGESCAAKDKSNNSSSGINKNLNLRSNLTSPVLPNKIACHVTTAISAKSKATSPTPTSAAALTLLGTSMAHEAHHSHEQELQQPKPLTLLEQNNVFMSSVRGSCSSINSQQQTIEKLSRPLAFDKMEALVREMQDTENGVPVRQQKIFLTSIPYAFMGYDLIEWLMDRLLIEESEALNIANQLCLHGYFFPVNDTKSLTVKDDSSLYRFQTPYYWPWQHKAPDNVEYAIYLTKRSLRNKQRHALEDYEAEALTSLHKNLKGKWDFISMQAEEQVRLAKERKKGDKIVGDSQERAYWRVHRPPPGQFTPLEACPVPSRDRQGSKTNKKKTCEDMQRDVDYLKRSLNRTRMKMSQACETLVAYSETFVEYDYFLQPVLPSNPWVTEDITFWQLNNTFVDIPTEKRVKRWAISIEELVFDSTGLQEFTTFLEKEYSHENIRFWIAVNRLRRSAQSQVSTKVNEIYEEFLKPGAPCEINIDGKTMENVLKGLKSPSRFTFDSASEHIYMLLLKKDCYPRFIRSDHYKRLLETGIQPSYKKRFFNFSAVSGAKKKMTAALSNQYAEPSTSGSTVGRQGTHSNNMSLATSHTPTTSSNLVRRRGSDRSLTGSAHELTVIGLTKETTNKVPHSHSQSNLSEIPFRDISKAKPIRLETTVEQTGGAICPWDEPAQVEPNPLQVSVCPWDEPTPQETPIVVKNDLMDERNQRNSTIRHQNTVDSAEACKKMLMPSIHEQRRASVSYISSHSSDEQSGSASLGFRTDNIKSQQNIKMSASIENDDNVFEEPALPTITTHVEPTQPTTAQIKANASEEEKPLTKQISKESCHENVAECKVLSSTEEVAAIQEVQIELIEALPCIEETSPVKPLAMISSTRSLVSQSSMEVCEALANLRGPDNTINKDDDDVDKEDNLIQGEEMSPTSEEYQEGSQFGENQPDMGGYEMTESEFNAGYIPPAPTPAPSLAPLAELDMDNVEDDLAYEEVAPAPILPTLEPTVNVIVADEHKKRRKKRSLATKSMPAIAHEVDPTKSIKDNEEAGNSEQNTVCPWEDDNNSASGGTFVKTYATLGYL